MRAELPARRSPPPKPFLFGYDKDGRLLEKARLNARAAGVENWILFQQRDVAELTAPSGVERGMIITNPPYGERLEDTASASALMGVFAKTLKSSFVGWDCWILSGNAEAMKGLHLKAERRIPVWNAQLDCRLLKYPIT
jgi:putative N6-adenine-specific DNA methylase